MTKLRRLAFAHDTWFLRDTDGAVWTDRGLFTWDRYLAVAERVTVVSRMRDLPPGASTAGLARVSHPDVDFMAAPNLATARGRLVLRRSARRQVRDLLADADALVARLPSEIGGLACRVAGDMGRPWAVELVTCPWDSLWNYGTWQGRVFAPLAWWETRRLLRRAPFSLYVTERFLQRRYPPGGHAAAVSDVAIEPPGPEVLDRRLARVSAQPRPVVFGTIAALLPFKGLDTAFAALARAASALPPFEYRVLGAGDPEPFRRQAVAAGIGERVRFDGTLPAGDAVLGWLDDVDVYLQPSRQEGLPRALVEAMSRGCPALGSEAGGIPELLDAACLHGAGDVEGLARLLADAADPGWQERQARRNVEVAARYVPAELDERRRRFWAAFAEFAASAADDSHDVLFVTPYAQLGGSERQLLLLLDAGVRGRVVALQDGPLLDRLDDPLLLPTGAGLRDVVASARRLRAVIRADRPAVVHASCAKGALVAGLAAVGLGVPVLFVKHDFYWDGPVAWLAAALCDQVVSGSRALNRTFPPFLRSRLHVVHPGVPAVVVDRDAGRRRVHALAGAGAGRVVAVVGRLHPDKGQLDALHAVAAVPEAHLLVVGAVDTTTPAFEAELQAEAEALGVRHRVTLAGEQDDVVELLAGCDVVLVPTTVPEGFGLVAVEAMRAGTPVVAYGHGGVVEVVGDCGVLAPPGDRAALGSAVARLLADEQAAARLGACGPRRAELFTAEATVAGMRARYREATSRVTAATADPHASDP